MNPYNPLLLFFTQKLETWNFINPRSRDFSLTISLSKSPKRTPTLSSSSYLLNPSLFDSSLVEYHLSSSDSSLTLRFCIPRDNLRHGRYVLGPVSCSHTSRRLITHLATTPLLTTHYPSTKLWRCKLLNRKCLTTTYSTTTHLFWETCASKPFCFSDQPGDHLLYTTTSLMSTIITCAYVVTLTRMNVQRKTSMAILNSL